MKVWQLNSIMRWVSKSEHLLEVALGKKEWQQFGEWFENIRQIVKFQDRDKLDYELPTDYVEAVLRTVQDVVYMQADRRYVRSYRFSPHDIEVPLISFYRKYGGELLEDVFEKGSTPIEP